MAVYVGIDQSLRKIGVCVLQDGQIAALKLLKPPPRKRATPRLLDLRNQLYAYLKKYASSIDGAAIEAQSLGSVGDLDQLGQISGVAQIVLADLGVEEPLLVPPATLKKFVTGYGQATKAQMMSATRNIWKVAIYQDDMCDAHGLARFVEEFQESQSTVRHQIEAVARFRTPKQKQKFKTTNTKHL